MVVELVVVALVRQLRTRGRRGQLAELVAGGFERRHRLLEIFGAHQQVIGIEARNHENAHPGAGQRQRQRRHHPDQGEVERADHLDRPPVALARETLGDQVFAGDDRQLVAAAGGGIEGRAAKDPARQAGARMKTADTEALGEDGQGKAAPAGGLGHLGEEGSIKKGLVSLMRPDPRRRRDRSLWRL